MEPNGHISFLPLENQRPLTPKDLNLSVAPDRLVANVILDGQVMEENLHNIGNNQEWLEKQLKQQHYKVSEILLATCDCQNTLTIYPKTHKRKDRDIFD